VNEDPLEFVILDHGALHGRFQTGQLVGNTTGVLMI